MKSIEAEYSGRPLDKELEEFIIEQIMKIEDPDLISIYPPLTDIKWGAPIPKVKTNREIAEFNSISKISYEINNITYSIKA